MLFIRNVHFKLNLIYFLAPLKHLVNVYGMNENKHQLFCVVGLYFLYWLEYLDYRR